MLLLTIIAIYVKLIMLITGFHSNSFCLIFFLETEKLRLHNFNIGALVCLHTLQFDL